jgi:DNA-binding NarL/FixJ family response regulator
MAPEAAAEHIRRLAAERKLDGDAVAAVLQAAGRPPTPRKGGLPSGLSEREAEVLRLAVRGLTNREMAEALVVSPKTVGHHLESIYRKAGVSTRAGATIFALRHGLVGEESA